MRSSAEVLRVSPESLWNEAGCPLFTAGTTESRELTALRIVQGRTLTDSELALLVLAGTEHLFQYSNLHPENK